ncbi:energy transducer TonB [Phaeocystidibacter marisrubri]|uniref:Energy transducer TonB n=1 Tax=Phaeocystidibacter marisrubri TaxID=1577780 RepID=A0A6L3ZDU4_9FLAO|nr:energy transducer TonB [Phaeocystidibacter marisrubri]KAB2815991.1 energy transducer TonB [Phaeocystidibacter marisrubri]GGH66778.1 hypothetical protein GCM10011318_05080 [Phaeocystidibacter marisrubri]
MATKDERNGRIGTIVFHAVILILFFFVGLKYQDPPPENGIAINFGYDAVGGGTTSSAPSESEPQVEETVTQPTTQPTETNVATQDVTDAPSVNTQEQTTEPTQETQPDPQPDSRLTGALSSVREGTGEGEGATEGGGDQGDPNGDPNSPNRTGVGGTGSGGNYRLGNRNALSQPKPTYDSQDQGRVVVKVYVDRTGRVVRAEPGVDIPGDVATNVFSSVLFDRARAAALATKWQGDPNAVEEQIGYIIYYFGKQ